MHPHQVCTPILPLHKALDFRLRSLITHVRYQTKICSIKFFSNIYLFVKIVDGTQSSVLGNVVVQATLSLTLADVLYVPKILVSLLSISQFIKLTAK